MDTTLEMTREARQAWDKLDVLRRAAEAIAEQDQARVSVAFGAVALRMPRMEAIAQIAAQRTDALTWLRDHGFSEQP